MKMETWTVCSAPEHPDGDGGPSGEGDPDDRGYIWLFFSFHGRIGRAESWAARGAIWVVGGFIAMFLFAVHFESAVKGGRSWEDDLAVAGLALLFAVPLLWSWLAVSVKRLRGANRSLLWLGLGMVPGLEPLWSLLEKALQLTGSDADGADGGPGKGG
jgi:uncharacterized membrane protein YhaH (DUF805 family)